MSKDKHALLVGINYIGTRNQLHGCINDVSSVKQMLLQRGFKEENIVVLTDNTPVKPFKANIISNLVSLCGHANSDLFFHYSGHGTQVPDRNSDEEDGKDEALCPLDFNRCGMITDDDIRTIVNKVPSDSNLFVLADCCHSGTICDLAFNIVQFKGKYTFARNNRYGETLGNVMLISGCQDPQTSIDGSFEGKSNGALTYAFLFAVQRANVKTWNDLYAKVLNVVGLFKFPQIPHLSSGKNISCESQIFGF